MVNGMQETFLGDYKIIKHLGQGALGTVYLAEHRFIKRSFVLKVLPPELTVEPGFIARFEDEVTRISRLEHPHIVKTHTVSCADEKYFLVTDCILDSFGETTNLAQYMAGRKERLREDELFHVLQQVASALDYAHLEGGMSHRTLKLNNILIGKGKPGCEIFLSDFGLAKVAGLGKVILRSFKTVAETLGLLQELGGKTDEGRYTPHPLDGAKVTKLTASFLQNFAFMSPEQKKGEAIGPAADRYAFGVLSYFLISGLFPEGAFVVPSKLAPDYQKNWDHLVMTCLHPLPEARPKALLPLLEEISKPMDL